MFLERSYRVRWMEFILLIVVIGVSVVVRVAHDPSRAGPPSEAMLRFRDAIENDEGEKTERLLDQYPDLLETPLHEEQTPLEIAARCNTLRSGEALLNRGYGSRMEKRRALLAAVEKEHPKFVALLMIFGVPSSDAKEGLNLAALRDEAESVAIFLESKVPVDCEDELGETPLFHSGKRCYPILLEHGADPNHRATKGYTPLHTAAYDGDIEKVRALLNAGALREAKDADGLTPYDWYANLMTSPRPVPEMEELLKP